MFRVLDSLSLPGDPDKANEDAFASAPDAAAVFDGATVLGENLLPGKSDAAWIAQFGARRLMAHLGDGDAPLEALRHALMDTKKSFEGLRRRAPKERYEIPFASMMLVAADGDGFDAFWFGDCGALVRPARGEIEIVGEAFDKRAAEARRVRMLSDAKKMAPVGGLSRQEMLPHIRSARNAANTAKGGWLFSPDPRAAEHVSAHHVAVAPRSLVLLASDGFLALASDYGAYDAKGLMAAAHDKGLRALGEELRRIEAEDGEGLRFPRFKQSDDATAVLLEVG